MIKPVVAHLERDINANRLPAALLLGIDPDPRREHEIAYENAAQRRR
jgi:hypothetical protein